MGGKDPVILVGMFALLVGWTFTLMFVIRYAFLSSWRFDRTGRALMGFMATVAVVLTFNVAVMIVGAFPGLGYLSAGLAVLYAMAAGKFLSILVDVQRAEHRTRREIFEEVEMRGKVSNFFRREPTLYIGVLAAAANWLVGFQFDWLTAGQAALWMTAINAVAGVVAAVKTRPIPPQAFTYAVTSLAGLGAAYGLDYSQEQVGQFNTMVLAVMMFLARGQVSPKTQAPVTGVLGDKVTTP